MIARNTRDEFVNIAAKARERRMYKNLEEIQRMGRIPLRQPASGDVLSSFAVKLEKNEIPADKFLTIEQERLNLEFETTKETNNLDSIERETNNLKPTVVSAKINGREIRLVWMTSSKKRTQNMSPENRKTLY